MMNWATEKIAEKKVIRGVLLSLVISLFSLSSPYISLAEIGASDSVTAPEAATDSQSLEELLTDAQQLFATQRPIDARTKLLKAMKIAPEDFRVHMYLGAYYLSEVGHFRLAYRYLKTAEKLFEKKYGNDEDGTLQSEGWQQHARLLYFLSEAELNLDRYEASLKTLDRFGKKYWDDWYPGARAWVLMKLKRVDEAISVAQAGLLRGAESGRTYNILGILLSLKDNRELSLQAFARAIRAESIMGVLGQVATPLNNAGEVYRELFQDNMAEAAWVRSVKLPDGCEHILPSLNLAILYIDELRLLQASRVLDDFQACYAAHAEREDSEHRALIALARGRIALRQGHVDEALALLQLATERQQWFGKIGTNEADVRFAALISLGDAYAAEAEALRDTIHDSVVDALYDKVQIPLMELRSLWYSRRAREVALDDLSDLKDLYVRNTDTMLEYPTLGGVLSGFPEKSLRVRTERVQQKDKRPDAQFYYKLYLGENLLEHGKYDRAEKLITEAGAGFRPFDRLVRAEALAHLLVAKREQKSWWSAISKEKQIENIREREELYTLLPSHLRYHGFSLPVVLEMKGAESKQESLVREISKKLSQGRFEVFSEELASIPRYVITVSASPSEEKEGKDTSVTLILASRKSGHKVAEVSKAILGDGSELAEVVNAFIGKVFESQSDPPGEPLPRLTIIDDALGMSTAE